MFGQLALSLLLVSAALTAQADTPATYKCTTSPVTMLEDMSNALIKTYKKKQSSLKNKAEVQAFAKKTTQDAIMPSLDAEYMAKQIVGRYNWNSSKPKDKQEFIDAYQKALAAEYSKFLLKTSQRDNELKFYPSRQKSKSQTVVFATVQGKKKQSRIGFYLHCVDNTVIKDLANKTWMIYDITIDDISYLDQFKVSVSSTVRNSGLAGLTKKINEYTNNQSKSKKSQ